MSDIKLSIAIPYKRRLENIRIAFEGLASQTMHHSEFEVLVGAMEYSEEYVGTCREFADRLNIVSVMSSADFEAGRARNLAMRQASGEVIVLMDADILLATDALETLYTRYFSSGQSICIVGQVVGYGNNRDGDVASVELLPHSHYAQALYGMRDCARVPRDPRFHVPHVLPWALAWTGLIALPARTIRDNGLYFSEEFQGWGVEDSEWGYRINQHGIPIVLKEDVYGLHLPHARDTQANFVKARKNWRRFLRKWPSKDVELAAAFGDVDANRLFGEFQSELDAIRAGDATELGIIKGRVGENSVIIIGAELDEEQRVSEPSLLGLFDSQVDIDVLPLVGICLPYEDASIDDIRVLEPVKNLSQKYWESVAAEIGRVSGKPVGSYCSDDLETTRQREGNV